MVTIDTFVQSARNFGDAFVAGSGTISATAGKEYIEHFPKCIDSLSKLQWSILDPALAQLSERPECSLGTLTILAAKAMSPEFIVATNADAFLAQLKAFISNANPVQFRMCPGISITMFQRLNEVFSARHSSILLIQPISQVIRSLQAGPRQITSLHATFFQVCLDSLALKAALPFLVDDVDDFSSEMKGSDGKALLLYFYYGGMIYAALRKYKEALFFFEACLRVPALTLSYIMLEAYKKFVLLSLCHDGEIPLPPKCAMQTVNRILKPNAVPYNEIATAFLTHNPAELNNTINRHIEVIRRDTNFGIVKQVKNALTKLNIKRLTKTFLTLSLVDLAARVQLPGGAPQAEKLILYMIQDGEIYARINQKDGMVVFLDNREKYNNAKVMHKIEDQIAVCVELNRRLGEMNEKLATNPEYVSKISMSNEDEGISSSKIPTLRGSQFEPI